MNARRMLLIALACLAGLAPLAGCSKAPPLPTYGTVPEFALVDQTGAAYGSAELRGHVWVANFIFTRCPDICPVFTARLAEVQKLTPSLAPTLRLVSISVDPEHDTPPVLAEYARARGADPARWSFLTGSEPAVRAAVEKGLMTHMDREGEQGGVPNIAHGSHFVLVDRELKIRGVYDMNDADAVDRVVRDATRLVKNR
jgi:protein SCO1